MCLFWMSPILSIPLLTDISHILSLIHIFAYRTFIWDSEASIKAHVHCVIVGFSRAVHNKQKIIYSGENAIPANNINGYLLDAENIFIEKRMKPLCNVPEIAVGGQAIDGGFLILTEEEKEEFLEKEPPSIACPPNAISGTLHNGFILFSMNIFSASSKYQMCIRDRYNYHRIF